MNREKINKAAQLADDLKKIDKALAVFDNNEKVAVRCSASLGDESVYAYLPKSVGPAIYSVLVQARGYTLKQMEDL